MEQENRESEQRRRKWKKVLFVSGLLVSSLFVLGCGDGVRYVYSPDLGRNVEMDGDKNYDINGKPINPSSLSDSLKCRKDDCYETLKDVAIARQLKGLPPLGAPVESTGTQKVVTPLVDPAPDPAAKEAPPAIVNPEGASDTGGSFNPDNGLPSADPPDPVEDLPEGVINPPEPTEIPSTPDPEAEPDPDL